MTGDTTIVDFVAERAIIYATNLVPVIINRFPYESEDIFKQRVESERIQFEAIRQAAKKGEQDATPLM